MLCSTGARPVRRPWTIEIETQQGRLVLFAGAGRNWPSTAPPCLRIGDREYEGIYARFAALIRKKPRSMSIFFAAHPCGQMAFHAGPAHCRSSPSRTKQRILEHMQ